MLVTGMCLVDFSKYPLVLGMPELRGLRPGRYRVINMEEYLFGAIVAHHVLLCLWLELPQGSWAEEIHTWGDHSLGIFSGSHLIPGGDGFQTQGLLLRLPGVPVSPWCLSGLGQRVPQAPISSMTQKRLHLHLSIPVLKLIQGTTEFWPLSLFTQPYL